MNLLQLAWKNISGNGLRSWVVALCALVVAAFALFATLLLRGAATSLELAADRLGADIVVVPEGAQTEMEGALLMGVPAQFWMPTGERGEAGGHPRGRGRLSADLPGHAGGRLVLLGVRDVHDRLRSADRLHGAALAGASNCPQGWGSAK